MFVCLYVWLVHAFSTLQDLSYIPTTNEKTVTYRRDQPPDPVEMHVDIPKMPFGDPWHYWAGQKNVVKSLKITVERIITQTTLWKLHGIMWVNKKSLMTFTDCWTNVASYLETEIKTKSTNQWDILALLQPKRHFLDIQCNNCSN